MPKTPPKSPPNRPKLPEAEALLAILVAAMRPHAGPAMALVGIRTGGVWLAERLHAALGLSVPLGSIDVSFHRDDYGRKGLHPGAKGSSIPFDVAAAEIVIVDDVLNTGRTIRAAMNELYDYGRPARIDLAVLVDRGGRELPICARYCAHTLAEPLPASQELVLARAGDDPLSLLSLQLKDRPDE
ncbi:MAG: bifunctional pyr operon transcriptional regulator/uracil phosphoribosyltransferase PyrR [Sterolibacterium sp.]